MRPLDFFYMGLLASLGPARKSGEMAGKNKNRSEKTNRPAIKKQIGHLFFLRWLRTANEQSNSRALNKKQNGLIVF